MEVRKANREDPEDQKKISDARIPWEERLSRRLHSPGLIESDVVSLNIDRGENDGCHLLFLCNAQRKRRGAWGRREI